jgi:hypothetical protein
MSASEQRNESVGRVTCPSEQAYFAEDFTHDVEEVRQEIRLSPPFTVFVRGRRYVVKRSGTLSILRKHLRITPYGDPDSLYMLSHNPCYMSVSLLVGDRLCVKVAAWRRCGVIPALAVLHCPPGGDFTRNGYFTVDFPPPGVGVMFVQLAP